ncbi:MAG: cytochrome c peroxidase [Candidatus Eiseniibacteriota bacterium]
MRSRQPTRITALAAATLLVVALGLSATRLAADELHKVPLAGMPEGTDFGLRQLDRPRQILRSEAQGGHQSYMVALGNTAFSSPLLFGEKARKAGLSCDTCHRQGDINPRFFIPGVSLRHGGLDPMTAFFNPAQDDGVKNHVDIPSLRGERFLAPYGRDGRIASLRDFVRHVIVNEFAGPEPSPRILDALVAYIDEIEFLPNPKIDRLGRLTDKADAAAKRGEALFNKPFAGMGGQACASCHVPDALFVDGRRHDVGSEGAFKTPTLLNARFTAPYFHDGRYATLDEVVAHFDRTFGLKLRETEQKDLVAYLDAVGDGEQPFEPVTRQSEMSEVASYVALLDQAIEMNDKPAIALVVGTVNIDLALIAQQFDNRDPRTGRVRRPDRPDVAKIAHQLIGDMTAIGSHAEAGDLDKAKAALETYRERARTLVAAYP